MQTAIAQSEEMEDVRTPPAWGAVFAMALCVVTLIASEFMPVSLLTPIAQNLGMSEGQAGQAISISGIFAVLTSLLNTPLTGSFDRKKVLLSFALVLVVSGATVTFATNGLMFMTGRALLGIAIGGFWSMSTATVMKLVPKESVGKGLALINGGNALAATIAAPLGSFLGQYIGWRGSFFVVLPLGVLAFVWQWMSLPALEADEDHRPSNPFRLLKNPAVSLGMGAILMLFMGQFGLFTYLRPFLENVTGVSVSTLSLILLLLGASGAVGNYFIGTLLEKRMFAYLIAIPVVMAGIAILLIATGHSATSVGTLLLVWGLVSTPAPVAWGLWLSRTIPDDAEAGGGLMVAVIQFAITLGAAIGGIMFDTVGWWSPFAFGAAALIGSALLAFAGLRASELNHAPA